MLLCAGITVMVTDRFNHHLVGDLRGPHVAFAWYAILLCLLVACTGLGFAIMQRARPEWLRHTPFVVGAIMVVLCSLAAALMISVARRSHSDFAWFSIPVLVMNIGLGLKMMWRNGRGAPSSGLGAGVRAGG